MAVVGQSSGSRQAVVRQSSDSHQAVVRQGRYGWQGPQGLGLAWLVQNIKQRWHVADVAATVAALPAKNWP
jgi:hypothetical protein